MVARWLLIAIILAVSIFRYQNVSKDIDVVGDKETKLEVVGRVWEVASFSDWGTRSVRLGDYWVEMPAGIEIAVGDKVRIMGMAKGNVIRNTQMEMVMEGGVVWRSLGNIRKYLGDKWQQWLPDETGGLVAGIILGGNDGLTKYSRDAFNKVGMSHVVAASGYNVALVVAGVSAMTWWVGRRKLIPFVVLCTLIYVFLAGMSPAIWRSAIMSAGVVIGCGIGRKSSSLWWLLISGTLMWLADPLIIKDIGFQLSVAAVAGITLWRGKREWETTLAAVMFTFPVIWHYFGQVSLIAVFANLLLLWTVPVIMFLGLVGMITFGWGAILVWPFAKLLIGGVHLLANLPWAAVDLPRISVYGEIFLVILVFTLVWLKTNWQNLR